MQHTMLKPRIHRVTVTATVTQADPAHVPGLASAR